MINDIIKDHNSFLKFIKFASRFYKADYYNIDNLLILYEKCPKGKAFATFEVWNNNGRRIIRNERGYWLHGTNGWDFAVFDISQTWGVRIEFNEFDKSKSLTIINNLIDKYKIEPLIKISKEEREILYNIIYQISVNNISKKDYNFSDEEKHFISSVTSMLVLNKCNYNIDDLLDSNILSINDKNNMLYLLDTAYYFYRSMMFEIKELEKKVVPLEKNSSILQKELEKKDITKINSYEKPSLFSLEEISEEQKELINVLKLGNSYQKGDEHIYRIVTSLNDKQEKVKELKESFGVGGRSYTYLDGESGYINYDSRGLIISPNDKHDTPLIYTWNQVYECYEDLIGNREYPSKELLEKLETLEHNKEEILNNKYNLTNLDITYQYLNIIYDKFQLSELKNLIDRIEEDKKYVEQYYETLEDIQDAVSTLNYYIENNIIKNEDLDSIYFATTEYNKEEKYNNELNFSTTNDELQKSQVDISKYIGKKYILKAENQLVSSDNNEEKEKFDIVYKFIDIDKEDNNYGLVEDLNTNEIIHENLDTIISSIDTREQEKNDYIDYLARQYVNKINFSEDGEIDIAKFELNIKKDLEEYCLKNYYRYEDLIQEYNVAALNMSKIKDGLGSFYTLYDVSSSPDGNYIENYKLTENEYNSLFNKELDKHIEHMEGLDVEPDYNNEYLEYVESIKEQQALDLFNDTTFKENEYEVFEDGNPLAESNDTLNDDVNINKDTPKINYHITEDIVYGGAKNKYKNNVEAIKLLKLLEKENRNATKEEQDVLAKYTGWGGISNAFSSKHEDWSNEYNELKELLINNNDETDYNKANESTLTSFYTPNNVIKTIWSIVERMGFKGGNILEPSMGIGNFYGNIPENLADSKLYGIELDNISAGISKKLYPNAIIEANGYEDTLFQDNFFDLAISNIPFANISVYDKKYRNNNFFIHDYYFEKTLDKIRPGGLIAFVTSTGTLDKKDNKARKYIAERADFLGAFRLPNNTFKDIANTKASTDVIFLRKKETLDLYSTPSWIETGVNEDGIPLNNYYIENPKMLLGKMSFDMSMYGNENTTSLHPFEDKNLNDLLKDVIQNFEPDIYNSVTTDNEKIANVIPAKLNVKNNSYVVIDNIIYQRNESVMIPLANQSGKNSERIKDMIKVRDALRMVLDLQMSNGSDSELSIAQYILNGQYDAFVKKHGFINEKANMKAFEDDPDVYLLSSIEDEYKKDNKTFYKKGIIFSERIIRKNQEKIKAENAVEALTVSLNELGEIDISYIATLLNKSESQIKDDLSELIYIEPTISEERNEEYWVTAAEYLSGNVREKLKQAELLNNNGSLNKNIEALKLVQPKDLTASEIDISLGAIWIPPNIIKDFCIDLVDIPYRYEDRLYIDYIPEANMWQLQKSGVRFTNGDIKNTKTWGTKRADALTLIKTSLNLKSISIFDKDAKNNLIFNAKETAIAREKQNEIKEEFKNWVNRNEKVRDELVKLYNERFNSIRLREYDGSFLNFKGMSSNIDLREHQRNAVARILFGGNTLLAHAVGAGKTFEMATASMELKRLGLANKPMFVVPNHLTEQWGQEFLRLYPNANILVATKKDFQKEKRKKFMAKIATGEWDAVIIGHSSFGKIPVSKELEIKHINEEIKSISSAIERIQEEHGNEMSVKKMVALQKNLSNKLKLLLDDKDKDDNISFEELGIDYLFVDEAHEFKNLALFSKMNNVSGVSSVASQKASDLYMKIKYLETINPNKCVTFATGTPISNSMAELYTMQKYLSYNTLNDMGLSYFDSWASIFGQTVTTIELTPDSGGFRNKTRFAKFNNVPELLNLFRSVADVQTAKMLDLPIPKLKFNRYEIVSAPKSEELSKYIEKLVERSEDIRTGMVPAYEDNMLKVTNDGRKAALDLRLIDSEMPDLPDSKVNMAVSNITKIYNDTKENKSTQLVFCDLSTPKSDGSFSVYDDIKKKLILNGVLESEIAFIHDADNEQKKAELFESVRIGKVRILIGSTQRMGAGTNVQNKLIALHHLDCPWRPSDIEQREGRILRQGNENSEVQIFRYITEGSFDAYSYQLVETKANFINQIMTSNTGARSMEDVDDSALTYAEVKAIATGNPLLIEKFKVETDLKQLSILKARYDSSKREMENDITVRYPTMLKEHKSNLQLIEEDIPKVMDTTGDNFSIEILGVTYTDRSSAGDSFLKLKSILKNEERVLGHISGFEIIGYKDEAAALSHYYLKGSYKYPVEVSLNSLGNIIKIENVLKGITNRRDIEIENINKINIQIEQTKEELQKPFNKLQELNDLMDKKEAIYKELGINDNDEQIIENEENIKQFDMNI